MHFSVSRLRVASVVSACLGAAIAMFPAASAPANELYNFNPNDGNWFSPTTPAWEWSDPVPAINLKSWKAFCTGSAGATSILYSPCLEVKTSEGQTAGRVDFDFSHRFRFQDSPLPDPLVNPNGAGQVQFMVNNSNVWLGVSLSGTFGGLTVAWDGTGEKVVPTFSTSDPLYVPPLANLGANLGLSFVGTSPKYANTGGGGNFDDSSFSISGLNQGDLLQFRFVSAMFSSTCPTPVPDVQNALWDVNLVEIKGVVECVPEPGSVVLAATGLIVGLGSYWRRRTALAAALRHSASGVTPDVLPVS